MLESVWTSNTGLSPFPPLAGDLKTDVLIIGGGMAGLLCADALAREGVDYALIEADRILGGVTRNTTAKITSQHGLLYAKLIRAFDVDTAGAYWQANEAALEQFCRMAENIDCDFERKDNYIYSLDAPQKLEKEMAALEKIGARAEWASCVSLPFPVAGAVKFPDQAQFHPLKFGAALAKGLHIYEQTKALAFEGNTVLTARGKITASKIIVATHFPILNKHGGYFLKMYQHRSYVLALENAGNVDGMYLDESGKGLSFRNHGDMLLLGGGGHRTGKPGSGWSGPEDCARRFYPNAGEIVRWATQDCMTLDGIPYIGQYSRNTPNLYVATGFNKWGMTSAMVSAGILADLVQGRENPWAFAFSPSRRMLRPQLFCNGLESAVNLLTPTKPRCPHLGCALKWNRWEHSWDCPCHGSRFSESGQLLENPATDDLKTSRSN